MKRRDFIKNTGLTALALAAAPSLTAQVRARGGIALVLDPDDAVASAMPPRWATDTLQSALEARGSKVHRVARPGEAPKDAFCVVAAGMSHAPAHDILQREKVTAPTGPEALCLVETRWEGRPVLLAAGTDALGLVYALTELADRVVNLDQPEVALDFPRPVVERPASRVRSIMRQFCSEVEDKSWFYDRDFWPPYLDTLVTSRLNRFSFTTGMGYNSANHISDGYFLFPFPFLLDVPGYNVRAKGLPDEERRRNLETLKFIARETARRGMQFQFAAWTMAYKYRNSPDATYVIEGLTDATHAAYCHDALKLLLTEIPEITGVTFRVHSESGIPEGSADSFWAKVFRGVAAAGRQTVIDMHGKNLPQPTLDAALASGMPACISPKYCGEHLGLPYHQAAIREHEMRAEDRVELTRSGLNQGSRGFTRYGYGDYLDEDRNYQTLYRIWPGTRRLLLYGDPVFGAGYGRNASFCDAEGIELSEPLSFKGRLGSGHPGGRCGYADKSLKPRYDFEKYLYTYRMWGRLGYNPDTDPEVWRRWLRREFGRAAGAIENAIGPAGRVMPLVTQAHGPSANCMIYWPEIYTDMPIVNEGQRPPYGDTLAPKVFGNCSSFDPQLFLSPDETADALLEGAVTGKYSPLEVAVWLENLANTATTNVARAHVRMQDPQAASFRRIVEDVAILAGTAHFFADKFRSAVLWRVYTKTGDRDALNGAIEFYVKARDTWAAMAERAKKVYVEDVSFGGSKNSGHWADRLPAMDRDLADMRQALNGPAPAATVDAEAAARVIRAIKARPQRLKVSAEHAPAKKFTRGQTLAIELQCRRPRSAQATLHYRHVNQTERWQSVAMSASGRTFQAAIPANYTDTRYPLQYYFEVADGKGAATIFPGLDDTLANVPYYVVGSRRA